MSMKRPNRLNIKSNNIHSLTTSALPRSVSFLQEVPENDIVNLDVSPTLERHAFRKSQDWNNLQKSIVSLFQRKEVMGPGELCNLHDNVRNILASKTGPFLFDYYKQELLPRGMIILREDIRREEGDKLLGMLEEVWDYFFKKILPSLDVILYLIRAKEVLTVRQTALIAFRDIVLLKIKVEEALESVQYCVSSRIKHMFLILQCVNDTYPPNKNKLKLESLVARTVIPFLGFKGLYEGEAEPTVISMEPVIAARRKSADWRRISRPLSVQPKQMETLNELFLNAIRKQQDNSL